jgi:hypothetical protein
MVGSMSVALVEEARAAMAVRHYREAGRLALEAADAAADEHDFDVVSDFAEEAILHAGFMQRGRFEAALEELEQRRATTLLAAP